MGADVSLNLNNVRGSIIRACSRANRSPSNVTLIAVTKTISSEIIDEAFRSGIRDFGENQVQEALSKSNYFARLQPRPTLHMIGHLQTNKIKVALGVFDFIHSVDSLKLAETINRQAQHKVSVLLEVNVSGEPSKNGFLLPDIGSAVSFISRLTNIDVMGLMTVAPIVDDPEKVRPVFRKLRELRDLYKLKHLSMGMTDDFTVAIEEGATMIRLGRAIFGERK